MSATVHPFRPKPDSVHLARAVMLSERQQVTEQSGIQFAYVPCEHCEYVAESMGVTEGIAYGRAVMDVIKHVMAEHNPRGAA